ncbi:MAG TPA: DUF882 domain-containing protein, partial [bacterium]|nr:DUF882 domain-containing protein [bacterium]
GVPTLLAESAAGPCEAAWPRGDGLIRVYNYHLNEFAEITFRKGETYLPDGLKQFQALLRSRDNSEQAGIDPRLLDLIDHLQDRYQADEIEIISGYRRKEFNESLLRQGHKVSPVSLHTKGQALDIHIDEVREETLRDYLTGLGLGGVGYYGPLDFVHVDVGPVRQWAAPPGQRKLVGVLDPQAPVRLTSDKNDYLPGETLYFTWEWPEGFDPADIQDLKLELFRRGRWQGCPATAQTDKRFGLPTEVLRCEGRSEPSYGKFRWIFRLKDGTQVLSSNEFYLKKQ